VLRTEIYHGFLVSVALAIYGTTQVLSMHSKIETRFNINYVLGFELGVDYKEEMIEFIAIVYL
jgi:hypothetical protein